MFKRLLESLNSFKKVAVALGMSLITVYAFIGGMLLDTGYYSKVSDLYPSWFPMVMRVALYTVLAVLVVAFTRDLYYEKKARKAELAERKAQFDKAFKREAK